MLTSLFIKNYALIQSVKLDFSKGLNVIIGETGAGKSIMLGALQLILGKRADTKVLFRAGEKCVVEGVFENADKETKKFLEAHELDIEDEIIIRREINTSGKSRAFINDTPVKLSILSELTSMLIDLHQQFDFLDIHQSGFQMLVVDTLADNQKLLDKFQKDFSTYKKTQSELNRLKELSSQAGAEKEFFQFQFNELDTAALVEGEQSGLEENLNVLSNAEGIKTSLTHLQHAVDGENNSILDQLNTLTNELSQYNDNVKEVATISDRLSAIYEDLSDLNQEATRLMDSIEYDPQKIQEAQERLDTIYKLQQKHKKESVEELISLRDTIGAKLLGQESSVEAIEKLEKELKDLESSLDKQAQKLSDRRKKAIPKIEKSIQKTLTFMAMPNAKVQVRMEDTEQFTNTGKDKVVFYFAANKGFDFTPLHKAASGGEISRLNLSIKSLIAGKLSLPTLVFDEIDAGISGEVARKMGNLLNSMSSDHQIICITHSPQIAAQGEKHFFVYKDDEKDQMETNIKVLEEKGIVFEIAKMLSGEPPTPSALDNARELIAETAS